MKKEGWGGGGTRTIKFTPGNSDAMQVKVSGKTLNVSIGNGLPKSSREYQNMLDSSSVFLIQKM